MMVARIGNRTPVSGSGFDHRGYTMSSAYDSASTAPRTIKWYASPAGPNSLITSNHSTLLQRSRQAERNDPHIAKALHALAINEIGIGIVPRPQASNDVLKDFIAKKWALFAKQADPSGVLDIYGMQMQAGYGRRVAGEVFIRRRRRSASDNLAVPLQIQMLEAEFVPTNMNRKLQNGNYIVNGVEFNKRSMRRAYMMYREHPGDSQSSGTYSTLRIPARDVIHNYRPNRIGAVRGVPDASRSLLRAHEYDKYDDAEMGRKQTRAGFTGTIERIPVEDDFKYDPMTGEPIAGEIDGDGSISLTGNTIVALAPGEKANMFDGDNSGSGFADFQWLKKLTIALGMNVPYELMSGDWSKVNDRLVRAILNEFHRQIEADQDHLSIFQVCRGIWGWFIEALAFVDDVPQEYFQFNEQCYDVIWQPQAWRYLNPVQDVKAKADKIAAQLSSRQIEIAKEGRDVEIIDKHLADDEARIIDERRRAGLADQQQMPNGGVT